MYGFTFGTLPDNKKKSENRVWNPIKYKVSKVQPYPIKIPT